jgi:hypothetical protein
MIVISNGMLRSGSTLQYNIAASLLELNGPLTRAGFLGDFRKPEVRAKLDAMKAAPGWTILKTHEAPLERSFYDDHVRVLFSYRDVRDIAASIKKKWAYPFEKILSDIDDMIEIERAFGDIPNVLVQSYDKLYADLAGAAREIADFLGVRATEADIQTIAAGQAIENQAESRGSVLSKLVGLVKRKGYDQRTLLHPDHISATGGRDGDWMNQFETGEIAVLNERFADWLHRHEYKPVSESAS